MNLDVEIIPADRSLLTKSNLRDHIMSVQIYFQAVFDEILVFSVLPFDYSVGGRQISDLEGLRSSESESQ